MDWLSTQGFSRLKEINPNFEMKDWYMEKVKTLDEIDNYNFYKDTYRIYDAIISPLQIIGTDHASYNSGTWIEMLGNLKRNHNLKSYYSIYEFIFNEEYESKENKSVIKFGDQYIIGLGNHRLCFSKFLDLDQIPVTVTEYAFDYDSFNIYTRLKDFGIYHSRFMVDGTEYGWEMNVNGKKVIIRDSSLADRFINYFENVRPDQTLKTRLKLKLYRSYPSLFPFVDTVNRIHQVGDFEKFRNEIILHKIFHTN
jgi:hypothetical protein